MTHANDANELDQAIIRDLEALVLCDIDDEDESPSFYDDEEPLDEIPLSLLSYLEYSKRRRVECEELFVQELEDEVESLEERLMLHEPTSDASAVGKGEEEEQRRRGEKDLEEKLRGMREAQKELLSNLKRQMGEEAKEEERRRKQEEKEKKRKDEEERKRSEKVKTELERQKLREQVRRMREEEEEGKSMDEEMRDRCEEEEQRKAMELKKRKKKEEERRREERNKMELEKKKLEDEIRMMEEEEMREAARKEREEEKQRQEEEEQRKMAEEQERKEEEEVRRKEEQMKMELEKKRQEEEIRRMREEEERKRMKEKEEAQRRIMEEKERKEEERREEEKLALEKKSLEDEMRRMREEEEQKRLAEEENKKREEEERKKEERIKARMEKQKKEDEMRRKEEEEEKRKKVAEEEERIQREEEERKQVLEEARRKRKEEERRKLEEDERKRADEEEQRRKEEVERKREEEEEKTKMEMDKRKLDDDRSGQRGQEEEKKIEDEKMEECGKKEGNDERKKRESNEKTEEKLQVVEEREEPEEYGVNTDERIQPKEDRKRKTKEAEPKSKGIEEEIKPGSVDERKTKTEEKQPEEEVLLGRDLRRPPPLLPDDTERKRLTWMKECVSWTELSAHNKRRAAAAAAGGGRSRRRTARARGVPPLCPHALLRAAGTPTLQEASVVTLEDLPSCSLSTLAQCLQLRSVTLRRCGLKALEGVSRLPQLRIIDAQENDISFVDCENMSSLRVLRLGHNKLTSIHGLSGAENLDVLDLSHNSITRIAGLQSARRLQTLSLAHNQLISTKGLRDLYTLLHLDCSHNHLASVEGLDNCALLHTLDLTANSLTEPPPLHNQVLLRELRLDDNSISSLRGLAVHWLPLLHLLSAAENRITQLPPMCDAVSLASLDLRFNCLSELKNVCESLEGCGFLSDVRLAGNPLLQESGWRSAVQKSVSSLRRIDGEVTDVASSAPQDVEASGSFLAFCQAQLQQTCRLQQRHTQELSGALLPLDAVTISCRHFAKTLRLAEEQRYAHEYGDTTLNDHDVTAPTEETLENGSVGVAEVPQGPETDFSMPVSPDLSCGDVTKQSLRTLEKFPAEAQPDTCDAPTAETKMSDPCEDNSGSFHFLSTEEQTADPTMLAVTTSQDLALETTAAVVIQQQWRKHRQKCGNVGRPVAAEGGGGDGGGPELGPSHNRRSIFGKDHAATVIQAFWRGFTLRRRLASALAAVTRADTGEDDTLEEVDLDALVFDEAELKKDWTSTLSGDSPPPGSAASEKAQPTSQKPPRPESKSYQYVLPPPLVWAPKHAWGAGEHMESAGRGASTDISNSKEEAPRCQLVCGLSEESERILGEWGFTNSHTAILMLKRAQKMKNQQQRKVPLEPPVHLAPFRSCSHQLASVEPLTRPAPRKCSSMRVAAHQPAASFQQTDAQMKQERVLEWLQSQSALSDRHSASEHFLPEISPDLLNGGRVQLVAKPGYAEHRHQDSGRLAKSSLTTQPCREISHPRRDSVGRARKVVSPPELVTSGPSKKERMSFRDNQVQLSGGWGCGKRRGRVRK